MGVTRDVDGGHQTTGDLESGRKAFAARAWAAARDHFERAEPGTLTPVDWHSLATAAYLVADRDGAIRAWQQRADPELFQRPTDGADENRN